ncbi:MAG: cysteine--tRNA ligase [Polyangiaceae bacterium]|nr:cysteine--tRNA ligase [Polyangiaceae bacterium]
MTQLPKLYSTLSRTTETFAPREAGKATIYCCGPTTYDFPHAGHARAALTPDILVRWLKEKGLQVTYVRNLTDVDDKILNRSAETGEPPLQLSARMADIYQEEMQALGCLVPDHEPKVSEHIAAIIRLIQKLIASGSAYTVDMPNGTRDVYFSVRGFKDYGKLSRRKIEDLLVGARVSADENKHDPLDFALWKGAPLDQMGWESPFGHGRPGWHIECSAMSAEYLGHGFDIHTGGMDLIFPHHENEIAQSEAACPGCGPMARLWLHNGFLNIDKEKMSKSLGNFVRVRDIFERNDPEAFRWFLLTVHYRGPMQFETHRFDNGRVVFPGIEEAEARVDYLYETLTRLNGLATDVEPQKLPTDLTHFQNAASKTEASFAAAMDDDLNTAVALAAIGELAKLGNELADLVKKRRKDAGFVMNAGFVARDLKRALIRTTSSLGLLQASAEAYRARTRKKRIALRGLTEQSVEEKVRARIEARDAKDFARADELRKELALLGIDLQDSPEGTIWSIAPLRVEAPAEA